MVGIQDEHRITDLVRAGVGKFPLHACPGFSHFGSVAQAELVGREILSNIRVSNNDAPQV